MIVVIFYNVLAKNRRKILDQKLQRTYGNQEQCHFTGTNEKIPKKVPQNFPRHQKELHHELAIFHYDDPDPGMQLTPSNID